MQHAILILLSVSGLAVVLAGLVRCPVCRGFHEDDCSEDVEAPDERTESEIREEIAAEKGDRDRDREIDREE